LSTGKKASSKCEIKLYSHDLLAIFATARCHFSTTDFLIAIFQ
jgi:hypothetical protein